MSDYETMLQSVKGLAKSIRTLNQQAVREYRPIVESILGSHSRDAHHIEHTLDHLLGFCSDEKALDLFKKLCRHYWDIDPAATAAYVYAYRDMWDSQAKDSTEEISDERPTLSKTQKHRRRMPGAHARAVRGEQNRNSP